jgi:WD40 repeat protein
MPRLLVVAGLLAVTAAGHAQAPPVKPKPLASPIVLSLSFSPDGSRLAVGGLTTDRDGGVQIWNVASRKLVAKSEPLAQRSVVAEFTPDGQAIAVANGGKTVPLLDPKTGAKVGEMGPFASEITVVTHGAKGHWIVLGADNTFRVCDESATKVTREVALGKSPYGWTVSPGGDWLFVGGEAGDRLWDLKTGNQIESFPNRKGVYSQGTFLSADRLLIGTNLGIHRLVEVPSGKELFRFKNEGGQQGLTYSAAAGILAGHYPNAQQAALTPFTLRPPTDNEKQRVAALLKECDSDDYPTREKAAAALLDIGPAIEPLLRQATTDGPSAEVRMRARVAREGLLNKPRFQLSGHTGVIRAMTFSPDGKLFATGGSDGLVILWDPATGKEVARWNVASE